MEISAAAHFKRLWGWPVSTAPLHPARPAHHSETDHPEASFLYLLPFWAEIFFSFFL